MLPVLICIFIPILDHVIGTQPVPPQHRRSTRSSSTGAEGATKVKKAKRISNSYTVLVVEEPVPLSGVCVCVCVCALVCARVHVSVCVCVCVCGNF